MEWKRYKRKGVSVVPSLPSDNNVSYASGDGLRDGSQRNWRTVDTDCRAQDCRSQWSLGVSGKPQGDWEKARPELS